MVCIVNNNDSESRNLPMKVVKGERHVLRAVAASTRLNADGSGEGSCVALSRWPLF